MNKTSIEWCDLTWNPVTGCKHGCPYCYARKIAERFIGSKAWPQGFKPTFHSERLNDPAKVKKPQTIFVCSMADLFGEWVLLEWVAKVFQSECMGGHTFIHLTKNPSNMMRLFCQWQRRVPSEEESLLGMPYHWFGTTVTGTDDAYRIDQIRQFPHPHRFISFEPLLSDPGNIDLTDIQQVIIGAQTNPYIPPPGDAVRRIVRAAYESGTKVFFKNSMSGVHWMGESHYVNTHELCWKVNKPL